MRLDALRLANAATRGLRAYDPGHDLPALRREHGSLLVELGSNENPLGPSPRAVAAAQAALTELHRYPDPQGMALKQALAARLGVDVARITLGNGSHELLMLLAQCFADAHTSVVYSQYGFAVFSIAAAAAGAQAIVVPALPAGHAEAPLGHDLAAIAAAVRADTRLVYLANPNNPTGTWFGDAEFAAFLAAIPREVLVVVDEAYHEYTDVPDLSTALALLPAHPNLIVTRTFSKAYGLAALRVGYAISAPEIAAVLERLRESFNVNGPAQAAAQAALADSAHVQRVRDTTSGERGRLATRLRERGWRVGPSQTNFLLVDLGRPAAEIERVLFAHAVVVRPMTGYGLPTCLRITVGSREENRRLLEALP